MDEGSHQIFLVAFLFANIVVLFFINQHLLSNETAVTNH